MQTLTSKEQADYHRLKKVVCDNWAATLECARAAYEIKKQKLYRIEFDTWEEFCGAVLGLSVSYVNRLISAGEVSESLKTDKEETAITGQTNPKVLMENKNLTPIGVKFSVPTEIQTESQARELAKVPEEKRAEVLAAAASNGTVTAASIAKAAAEPVIELDKTGFKIPKKCMALWQRRPEVQKLLSAVSLLRSTLSTSREADDILWRPVAGKSREQTWTELLTNFDKAYASIGEAMPFAVCPACQGQIADRCTLCLGRGMISEFAYKYHVTSDVRKVRETACRK